VSSKSYLFEINFKWYRERDDGFESYDPPLCWPAEVAVAFFEASDPIGRIKDGLLDGRVLLESLQEDERRLNNVVASSGGLLYFCPTERHDRGSRNN